MSGGSLAKLREAVDLAKLDWRDLMVAAFGSKTQAYAQWEPKAGRNC